MKDADATTHYAPAERLERNSILDAVGYFRREPLAPFFDAVPVPVVILNQHRQIVFCNQAFGDLSNRGRMEDIFGLRPGEALGCINAEVMDGGCGTSSLCRHCGAARAIVASLRGTPDTKECHMRRRPEFGGGVLDLQVFARPMEYQGLPHVLFTALEIAHEKRLRYMERTMFHGLINAAGGVGMVARLVDMDPDMETAEVRDMLGDLGQRLLSDVLYFRDLSAAEGGRLQVEPRKDVDAREVLDALAASVMAQQAPPGVTIHAEVGCSELLETDPRLLQHVLRSMLVNALEATEGGGEVTVGCRGDADSVTFRVGNAGEMPAKVREQIFTPYFSTKGENRGLGCHVMRMFGRDALGGELGFECADGRTTFFLRLPRVFPGKD